MYNTTRFFFPHGRENEAMDCTFKEFPTIEKAIAYAHRYSGGARFAASETAGKIASCRQGIT